MTSTPSQDELKIGVHIAYYSGLHLKHAETCRELSRAGIPILELHGSPYPEVSYAEMVQQALNHDIDVVVFLSASVATTPDDVRTLAYKAFEAGVVMRATHRPGLMLELLDFCAIPITMLQDMCGRCDAAYENSAVETVLSGTARPLFSPFNRDGTPLLPGSYLTPHQAFTTRAGVGVGNCHVYYEFLGEPQYTERISNPIPTGEFVEKNHPRWGIVVATYGARDHEQYVALRELEKYGMPVIEVSNCKYIDVARSRLEQIAIDELGLDGILSLDHDIIFKPTDILDLIEKAHAQQVMIGGLYCMRRAGGGVPIGAIQKKAGEQVIFFEGGRLEKAFYTGLGFTAIPKSIIMGVRSRLTPLWHSDYSKPLYPSYSLDITGSFYCGEDVSFCNRVHGLDVKRIPTAPGDESDWEIRRSSDDHCKIFIDTTIRIFHKGSYHYAVEDLMVAVPRVTTVTADLYATKAEAIANVRSAAELDHGLRADVLEANSTKDGAL